MNSLHQSINKNVVIANKDHFLQKIDIFKRSGLKHVHVLADFDRTLTQAFINGEERPSIISVLRDGDYLTPDYAKKAHALYNKYSSISSDLSLPLEERKAAMHTWWQTHFDLLIQCGLNKEAIKKAAFSEKIELRKGALEFVDLLQAQQIPLVILSSTGLGKDAVSLNLKKYGKLYDNISILSNDFNYDENGTVLSVKQPIIHSLNKDETILKDHSEVYEKVKDRTHVFLLGDSLSDLDMIKGFAYDHLLTIGFLNKNVEKNIENYKKKFDVVITHDSSMEYVTTLLSQIKKESV